MVPSTIKWTFMFDFCLTSNKCSGLVEQVFADASVGKNRCHTPLEQLIQNRRAGKGPAF